MDTSLVVFVMTMGSAFSANSALALPPEMIDVPNASFEAPLAPRVSPFARPAFVAPDDDDWLQTPVPAWWTFGAVPWDQSAGVFFNVPGALNISNADGEQVVFMFGTPDLGIYQDLATAYEIGRSYHLTVAIRGGSGGMPLDAPIEISLYYRDDSDDVIPFATTKFLNDNVGSPTNLLDVMVEAPAVGPGDPWACRDIGTMILVAVKLDEPHLQGGTWGIDNVRLESRDADRAAGDFNSDGQTDLEDYGHFGSCMIGPELAIMCCNRLSDIDGDGDADLADYALLSGAFGE